MADANASADEGVINDGETGELPAAQRVNTHSSAALSERVETCRICRSEGSPEDPLFYPCKCSGSIRFVHQYCLMEWLQHSRKEHCELCKTPFRFTKLYDANMPAKLPLNVLLKRGCVHSGMVALKGVRIALVVLVWLGMVPWLIRWSWRWMFWVADAAWAREAFVYLAQNGRNSSGISQNFQLNQIMNGSGLASSVSNMLVPDPMLNSTGVPFASSLANALAGNQEASPNRTLPHVIPFHWPQTDPSMLSSWTYLSSLTSNPRTNRFIQDVFEGQLITCVIIIDFILVFLIREWVVQQQPLVNVEDLEDAHHQRPAPADIRHGGEPQDQDNVPRRNVYEENDSEAQGEQIPTSLQPNGQGVRSTQNECENTNDDGGNRLPTEEEYLPIANAGPEARINIKWSSNGRARVPAPKDYSAKRPLLKKQRTIHTNSRIDTQSPQAATEGGTSDTVTHSRTDYDDFIYVNIEIEGVQTRILHHDANSIESHSIPDNSTNSYSPRRASGSRDIPFGEDRISEPGEFSEDTSNAHASAIAGHGNDSDNDPSPENEEQPPPTFTLWTALANWFWGDITINPARSTSLLPDIEQVLIDQDEDESDDELPFVPVAAGRQAPEQPVAPPIEENRAQIAAAAAQAGLDAEAVEDAEDLEGVLELVGLQGPIIGLIQTSAFCTLLVGATILCAVMFPYLGGKVVLTLVDSPGRFLIRAPLQIASFIADFVVDAALLFGGWLAMITGLAYSFLASACEPYLPVSMISQKDHGEKIAEYAANIAVDSATRLMSNTFTQPIVKDLGWSWILLMASAQSHASLTALKSEVMGVFKFAGSVTTRIVDTLSSGAVLTSLVQWMTGFPKFSTGLGGLTDQIKDLAKPLIILLSGLRRGNLTFQSSTTVLEPTLVYWNSKDRALAILAGYVALAALAAIYVALDTPITRSESGQRTEKLIRDTLRQAGGVLKVILIISIEMLVFPFYCGLLLDLAFLPLFKEATISSRWTFANSRPYTFCFVHWFVGTCYMFHFALFVGMCRRILRKGVLWFIRDPDDPTFHPVRDVLERGVVTQLRKIAFSAIVYGALVILCLGGVVWTIGQFCEDILPVYWTSTEPLLEFPADLFLYNCIAPLAIRLFRPRDAVQSIYAWWLRRFARILRLSHFLFEDRRTDEEGHFAHKPWALFFDTRPPQEVQLGTQPSIQTPNGGQDTTPFERDGQFVLTPGSDQYRPPKPDEAFLHSDGKDVYIVDKKGEKNSHFVKVYVPPFFRIRITLFMVGLWLFSAFVGLCVTLVPLVFGRLILSVSIPYPTRLNDIYAYTCGSFILSAVVFGMLNIRSGLSRLKKSTFSNIVTWIDPLRKFAIQSIKCAYVYGFFGLVLPLLFALVIQFYIILPLRTYVSGPDHAIKSSTLNAIVSMANNTTEINSGGYQFLPLNLTEHTIHVLQDYALGLAWVRVASTFATSGDSSLTAEAFRRITAEGYLNPNVRLVSRYFVLPTLLFAALILLAPLSVAKAVNTLFNTTKYSTADQLQTETLIFRVSYPAFALCAFLAYALRGFVSATGRWRALIRDEVYLVGERLHNFGEKAPPAEAATIVRGHH